MAHSKAAYYAFLYDTWALTYYYYFLTIGLLKRIYGVKIVLRLIVKYPYLCNYVVIYNILITYRKYEIYF